MQEAKAAQEKAQQERVQQEMGMGLFSQFTQNPDAVHKIGPFLERFANTANQEEQAQSNVPPVIEPSPNRATRRKKTS